MLTAVILNTKIGKCTLLTAFIFHAIFAVSTNQLSFSQNSSESLTSPIPTETIKIVDPITTQNVSTGQELTISGTSSDTNLKNCSVSVIVNNLRPYQPAIAKGSDDINDYSQWEFVLGANYAPIVEGENKITAKLECSSASPRWYSVFIHGVPNFSNDEVQTTVLPQGEQNTLPSNLSTTDDIEENNEALTTVPSEEEQTTNVPSSDLSITDDTDDIVNNEALTTVPSEEEQTTNVPSSDLSITEDSTSNNNDGTLLVSIIPQNDPISRGDSQTVTITVTDSASTAVANAEIDGNLIYPGDNFEKEFSGTTNSQGEFVYTWTIGENGDAGPLSVQVEVSSQEHPPTSATISFDVEDLSEESESESESE